MIDMARQRTAIDELADSYLGAAIDLDPTIATYLGLPGREQELPDLSPDGLEAVSQLRRRTLAALAAATPVDTTDRITVAALRQQLELEEQIRQTGAEESALSNIASPVQGLRETFDLMPTATPDDWNVIATRLGNVPGAITGYVASLRLAAERGDVRASRQVRA